MRSLLPTPLTKSILNRWTPVRAEAGRWVAYGSNDAGEVRAAARLDALPPDQKSDQAAV
jgi:hypothetical protein